MCDDRERLIGYVYDECDTHERREIEQHLETCHTCRREITGLRDVRQDLLAWDVPETVSVWRPFAPQRVPVTWRDVPTWMLAAAASLVFLAGAAGGVATHTLLPHTTVVAAPAPPALIAATASSGREGLANVSMQTGASTADVRDLLVRLNALERRLQTTDRTGEARVANAGFQREITSLKSDLDFQFGTTTEVSNQLTKLLRRVSLVEEKQNAITVGLANGAGMSPGTNK